MTYPPYGGEPASRPPMPPPADNTRKFLNMSGGVLAAVVTGLILLPFLCCVGSMVFCGIGGIVGHVTPTPTP